MISHEAKESGKPEKDQVTIVVNRKDVTLPDKKTTGLEIKQAAIAGGVQNVTAEFDLFRIAGKTQHPVLDGDNVTVHEKQEFLMLAPDHNS